MNLEEKIKTLIRQSGYMVLDDFMRIALQDDKQGYYKSSSAIGANADFTTAPEISQLFGETIAAFIAHQIQVNYKNGQNIQLLELGAGRGTLMNDILTTFDKLAVTKKYQISVNIFDSNRNLIKKQKQTLDHHIKSYNIEWIDSFNQLKHFPVIIIANEFFDALPIKQFIFSENQWQEKVIKLDEKNRLYFCSNKTDSEIVTNLPGDVEDGSIYEFSEDTTVIFNNLLEIILENKGSILMLDYGYFKPQFGDSLQSVYRHKYNDVLSNIGNADITSYVNFGLLKELCNNKKLQTVYLQTQGFFLKSMGIAFRAQKLLQGLNSAKDRKEVISSLQRLIAEDEMGNIFKAMIIENY
jgi:NADH dehydrogenase [ubiquinone] 1 alpha subcomplex assembly factor 7